MAKHGNGENMIPAVVLDGLFEEIAKLDDNAKSALTAYYKTASEKIPDERKQKLIEILSREYAKNELVDFFNYEYKSSRKEQQRWVRVCLECTDNIPQPVKSPAHYNEDSIPAEELSPFCSVLKQKNEVIENINNLPERTYKEVTDHNLYAINTRNLINIVKSHSSISDPQQEDLALDTFKAFPDDKQTSSGTRTYMYLLDNLNEYANTLECGSSTKEPIPFIANSDNYQNVLQDLSKLYGQKSSNTLEIPALIRTLKPKSGFVELVDGNGTLINEALWDALVQQDLVRITYKNLKEYWSRGREDKKTFFNLLQDCSTVVFTGDDSYDHATLKLADLVMRSFLASGKTREKLKNGVLVSASLMRGRKFEWNTFGDNNGAYLEALPESTRLFVSVESDMKQLEKSYRKQLDTIGRISPPMLTDFVEADDSLVYTLSVHGESYFDFVHSLFKNDQQNQRPRFTKGDAELKNGVLKMLASTQLRGLRPHELVAIAYLCGIDMPFLDDKNSLNVSSNIKKLDRTMTITEEELQQQVHDSFLLDSDDIHEAQQAHSALRVLMYWYFTKANRRRFGEKPILEQGGGEGRYKLNHELVTALEGDLTFKKFFVDTVQAGLMNYNILLAQTNHERLQSNRGFIYGQKYSLFDVMRICGWENEFLPLNVGGYRLNRDKNSKNMSPSPFDSMPIFVHIDDEKNPDKHYKDKLGRSDVFWLSKRGHTLQSPEYQWLNGMSENDDFWLASHFIPIFVRRKAQTSDNAYYFVGRIKRISETPRQEGDVVVTTLEFIDPIDPHLYRHLTGKAESEEKDN